MIILFTSVANGGILQFANQVTETIVNLGRECKLFVPQGSLNFCSEELKDYVLEYENKKTLNKYGHTITELIKKIEKFKPEMFIAVDDAICSELVVQRLKKIQKAIVVHDVTPHLQNFNFRNFIVTKIQGIYRLGAFRVVNKVVVLSEHSKNKFFKRYVSFAQKCIVLPLGAHLIPAKKERPTEVNFLSDEKIVLFFGRIDKYKGVDRLIAAFDSMEKRTNCNARLVIAGKSVTNEPTLVSDNKNIIIINRYISDGEMQFLFEHCCTVVLPYYEASQSGILPIAYKFGKPVIVSSIPGLKELVVEGVTGSIFSNNQELEQCIYDMVISGNNAGTQDEIRTYYETHYNWKRNVSELIAQISN